MMTAPSPVATRRSAIIAWLPRHPPGRAEAQNRVLALLARARLTASVRCVHEDEVAPWPALRLEFESRHGVIGIVPTRDGQPMARLCGDDGTPDLAAAAAALLAAEPVLSALEGALDSPLIPRALAPLPPDERIEVAIAAAEGPGAWLDAPVALLRRLPDPDWREPPAGTLSWALACRVMLGQLRFSASRAARLRPGDVLLPTAACQPRPWVRVLTPDGREVSARLDTAAGALQFGLVTDPEPSMPSDAAAPASPSGSVPEWTQLPVELSFELPRTSVALGVLAGLQPGAVIPVGGDASALVVTVYNGGREVGRGELVALGDGVGVRLLTALGDLR